MDGLLNFQGQIGHDGLRDLDEIRPPQIGAADLKGGHPQGVFSDLRIFFQETASLQGEEDEQAAPRPATWGIPLPTPWTNPC